MHILEVSFLRSVTLCVLFLQVLVGDEAVVVAVVEEEVEDEAVDVAEGVDEGDVEVKHGGWELYFVKVGMGFYEKGRQKKRLGIMYASQ